MKTNVLGLGSFALALAGALLSVGLLPASVAAQHFPPHDDLRLMLRYLVEDGATPGIVLALREADGSTVVLSHGDPGPGARPLGSRSVFEIGSINKTFTGALLADMVTRGEVSLSDPISRFLPEDVASPTWEGREITLGELATHHSGLPRLPDNFRPLDAGNPYGSYTVDVLYDFLANHELRRAPGAEGEYSNLGFGLLGHLLARAAGTTYRELVHERILDPLGMDMTTYPIDGEVEAWSTKGHRAGAVVPYWLGTEAIDGAGGLRSNAEDMLTYLAANLDDQESPLGLAMRMAHRPREQLGPGSNIGLGWQLRSDENGTVIVHGGGTGGYSAQIGLDPDKGVGFVMLTNTNDFPDDIGLDLLRRGPYVGRSEVDVPAAVLAGYAGVYDIGAGRPVVVRHEDEGWLTIQVGGNVRFRMYAASDSEFFLRRTPWEIAFSRDDQGRVDGLTLDLQGDTREGRRVSDEVPAPGTDPLEVGLVDLPLSADELARYEGIYLIELGERILELEVSGRDGHLYGQPAGQPSARFRFQGDHVFVHAETAEIRLVFDLDADRATAVTLHQASASFRGTRRP